MIHFSANLGFLWTEILLPDAIRAAKAHGFQAVECHWPYSVSTDDVVSALSETGLRMLSLNTNRGDIGNGENGITALTGREQQAQQFIDEAIAYAAEISCKNVHVMPGFVSNKNKAAQRTFTDNLRYACRTAALHGITILIEPLNKYDAPGYYLLTLEDALDMLERVSEPNLKIMFDCYHQQLMGGDLLSRFKHAVGHIGHVQFASVPARAEPDTGEVNYPWLFKEFVAAGYSGFFGAEYKPRMSTDAGLGWLADYNMTSC